MMTSRKVSSEVVRAFKGREKPRLSQIVYDNSDYHLQCREGFDLFGGLKWEDVSLVEIQAQPEGLCFFSDLGFKYYLPAYLLRSIEAYKEVGIANEAIVGCISRPRDTQLFEFVQRRMVGFNEWEYSAIQAYLQELLDNPEYPVNESQVTDAVAALDFWRAGAPA